MNRLPRDAAVHEFSSIRKRYPRARKNTSPDLDTSGRRQEDLAEPNERSTEAGSSLLDTAGTLEPIEGPGEVLSKGVMQG